MRRLDLRSTAFHEAGHSVVAVLKGISFSRVWILRRKDSDPVPENVPLGQLTRTLPINKPDFAGKLAESKIEAIQAFAGPFAECLAYPGTAPDWQINEGDFRDARSVLRFATIPFKLKNGNADFHAADLQRAEPEMQRLLQECCHAAEQIVTEHQAEIEKIATALLDRWELTQQEVEELCR